MMEEATAQSGRQIVPRLTIAIPTFNRAGRVAERLRELLPQLTPEVVLAVFDNGSTDETKSLFDGEFAQAPVQYHRSPLNRGMMRNFIRCFEETEGEWLWILGDDDPVRPDAVAMALEMTAQSRAGAISTTSNCNLNREHQICADLDEFFAVKDAPSLCHVSTNIYRRSAINPHFGCLAPSSFTVANIAVIILRMLDARTAPLELRTETLLVDRVNPRRWAVREVALGFSLIPEFVSDIRHQKKAALGVWLGTRWMLMWELMEVADAPSALRWKRLCRRVDAILAGYGVTWFEGCRNYLKNRIELRRALLLKVFTLMPTPIVSLLGRKLRRRAGGREVDAHLEFSSSP